MRTDAPAGTRKLGATAICCHFFERENRGPAGAAAIPRRNHAAN